MIKMTVPECWEGVKPWDELKDAIASEFHDVVWHGVLGMARIHRIHLVSLKMLNVAHWLRGWSWFGRLVNTCRTLYFAQAGGFLLEISPLLPTPPKG